MSICVHAYVCIHASMCICCMQISVRIFVCPCISLSASLCDRDSEIWTQFALVDSLTSPPSIYTIEFLKIHIKNLTQHILCFMCAYCLTSV